VTNAPFIHAGTSTGRRQFRYQGRAPRSNMTTGLELFRPPKPGSPWSRAIFQPIWDPYDIVTSQFSVRAKNTQIVPFRPFETQRLINDNLDMRNIIVKPRQVGASTILQALETAIAITCPNVGCLILTHLDETTLTMRETIKRFINLAVEEYGWDLEFGMDNQEALQILPYDSWFFFGTAGGSKDSGVGRSRTIQMFHGSELAHWGTPNPGAVLGGITESIPDNGMEFLESTPNGAVGPFYSIFTDRKNSYRKHFYPWFVEPSRRIVLPPGYQLTLTEEEQMLASTNGLTHDQIAWRRQRMADLQSRGLDFKQEYPEDEISCFTAGVRTAIPPSKLAALLQQAQATPFSEEAIPHESYEVGGTLKVWEQPRLDRHYIVACDVGGGHAEGDRSWAVVMDHANRHVVATMRGHWLPENFAEHTIRLARRYNEGYLSHEANGVGAASANKAYYELKYANYHIEQRSAATRGRGDENLEWKPGFNISPNMRTPLIRQVIDAIINNEFYCWDAEIIREATAVRIERGRVGGGWGDKMEVPKEVHDDGLMAYAQALALALSLPVSTGKRAKPQQRL